MKKFEVRLFGKNFLFNLDGEPGKFGFHARCFVEAKNEEEAGKMATILVRQNPLLQEDLLDMAYPVIRLEEIRKANPIRFLLKKSPTSIEFHPEE